MDALRRTLTLRRVATTASLAALLVTPAAAEAKKAKAKSPVITSVKPMQAKVGDTLLIKGRNFRKGKARNSVGFKRDGAAVVFVKAGVSTKRVMSVKLPKRLETVMYGRPAVFHLRVLASRFGKAFTRTSLSPTIAPKPAPASGGGTDTGSGTDTGGGTTVVNPPPPAGPPSDCDHDGVPNKTDADDDNDLLPDARENQIGTDGCKADTDGDGVSDGYEYRSAIDLNDDEYQQPNETHPYPVSLPYPNPLFKDASRDYDGDGLPMAAEYDLWVKLTPAASRSLDDQPGKATPLTYSDGMQYSVSTVSAGRRVPTLTGATYPKYLSFLGWLGGNGYRNPYLNDLEVWFPTPGGLRQYDILDVDRDGTTTISEAVALDADRNGYLSDDERDEDADGLSNFDELRSRMSPGYWTACYTAEPAYPIEYAGTDPAKPDTDGDGILDGADDQDHDDVPNVMELSRITASGGLDERDDGIDGVITGGGRDCKPDKDLDPEEDRHPNAFGRVNPFNPCMPDPTSRTCQRHPTIGEDEGPDWWSLQ